MNMPTTDKKGEFNGFPTPTKNFFSMPNAITDIIAEITNMAELKVIIYVIRHTWGFHEYGKPKAISVDEFMNGRRTRDGKGRIDKGTGLSHHSVIDGLKRAVDHEYLICEVDDSDLARVKKSYSLKMASEDTTPGEEFAPPEEFAPGEESTPQQCNICTTGVKNLHHSSAESSERSKKDTLERHSQKDTEEKQEGIGREQNSTAHPGADAQPARASQIEPYHPDFNAHQQKPGYSPEDTHGNRFALVGTRRSDLHRPGPADRDLEPRDLAPSQAEPTGEPPAGVAQADRRPARRTPEVAPAGTETHSQLSTLTVEKPRQASAKVEKKQGNSSSQVVTRKEKYAPPAQAKAQLTLPAEQVRTDYETIRACKLRLTPATIKALNELGEMDGMSFANLKDTIELIEDQELVKKRNIPIDVQVLASEDGYWRFDKWYPVVVRNRQKQASKTSAPPPTSASLPSYGHLSDEEYYASLRKGTTHARAAYAR